MAYNDAIKRKGIDSMITISYKTNLIDFEFNQAARKHVDMLSVDELLKVQEYIEEECTGALTPKEINDFFEFDFDFICEKILYRDPAES